MTTCKTCHAKLGANWVRVDGRRCCPHCLTPLAKPLNTRMLLVLAALHMGYVLHHSLNWRSPWPKYWLTPPKVASKYVGPGRTLFEWERLNVHGNTVFALLSRGYVVERKTRIRDANTIVLARTPKLEAAVRAWIEQQNEPESFALAPSRSETEREQHFA